MKLKFEEVIRKENINARKFIHHAYYVTVGKYLFAKSQEKKNASERFEQLDDEEVQMQFNYDSLVNELAPFQIHQLSTFVNQIIVIEDHKK